MVRGRSELLVSSRQTLANRCQCNLKGWTYPAGKQKAARPPLFAAVHPRSRSQNAYDNCRDEQQRRHPK
jgi:hypothetical protein